MSIIDGMYWEEQYKEGENRRLQKIEDNKKQNEFNGKMPCNNCSIKDMCKYAFSIEFKNYNKDVFEINIVCRHKK